MAYNRDWDKGKDSWNNSGYDSSSWNSAGGGNIHSRDEPDQWNDGKRRKFNNGGYDSSHANDEGSFDADYGQGEYDGSYHDDRSHQRGGFPKKRLVPSEPSPHVIFLGLDPDFTEADLQAYLTNAGCSIETVTIIRERTSGASKGFGFAQFASSEHAFEFVDKRFPYIQVPPPASHGASAAAVFKKAVATGGPHDGRRVKIDYSQSATPHDKGRVRQNMNDGTRDIGNAQAPVLLFRGLDPLSGPQAIHQAMKNSAGFGKEGAKGMKRIILIKDKVTMASFGFAFVEFVDIQSAATVLASTMSPQIHPAGFRISDRPVAGSFAHPYSFQPVADVMLRDDAALVSSLALGGVQDTFVRYWDETSTVTVLEFQVAEPIQIPQAVQTKEKEKKKRPKGDTGITAPPAASALPITNKPVTLSFNKGPMSIKIATSSSGPSSGARTGGPLSLGFSDDAGLDGSDGTGETSLSAEDSKAATAKKVAPLIASKKTVNNINKWNQVQEELTNNSTTTLASATTSTVTPAEVIKVSSQSPLLPEETDFEFSDMKAMTCLLCARKFKAQDQLERHNKESDLHKKNFKDANLRDIARQKAEAARQSITEKPTDQPRYRDRASERRIMHNQPDTPMPDVVATSFAKKTQAEGPPPPPSPPPPAVNPSQDQNNVGNKLLKMMGWKEGTGLGATGEGRIDPIQTAIYAQGVGLGASKGKEVGKYAEGYKGYLNMAQDAARERYGAE